MKPRAGFTLIELLIVVAIIAILAAIAVPNFLEAQTRSKVSRVNADQRTVATAMESYHVDNNAYPPPPYSVNFDPAGGWHGGLQKLTTPVSFITSIPQDPFLTKAIVAVDGVDNYKSFKYYMHSNEAYNRVWARTTGHSWTDPNRTNGNPFYGGLYKWLLVSLGPDKEQENTLPRWTFLGAANDAMPYDPTNGTISDGDIFRFGPGGNPAGFN